jgi:hypothetical protein
MFNRKLSPMLLFVALVLVLAVVPQSVTATALPITGFTNCGAPVANLAMPNLNTVNFIGSPTCTITSPGTGDLGGALGDSATIKSFSGNSPITDFMSFGGFTFDELSFALTGGNIISETPLGNGTVIAGFSANGIFHEAGKADTFGKVIVTAQCADVSCTGATSFSSTAIVTTPEPVSMALLGSGLVFFAVIRRRRQHSK